MNLRKPQSPEKEPMSGANIFYSCGHMIHCPFGQQDLNWQSEVPCPDCRELGRGDVRTYAVREGRSIAGWPRRIPNWLTVSGFVVGVVLSTYLFGWSGLKNSLLGTGLAFALLLPLWLLKKVGAGDVKFAAALGAYTGPGRLIEILIGSVFVAGVMALALVMYKRRFKGKKVSQEALAP